MNNFTKQQQPLTMADVLAKLMGNQQQQMPATRGLLPRKDISGNVEGTVPRGLDRWYLNNPSARSGEFDPTGAKGAQRVAQDQKMQDLGKLANFQDMIAQYNQGRLALEGQGKDRTTQSMAEGAAKALSDFLNPQQPNTYDNYRVGPPQTGVQKTPMFQMPKKVSVFNPIKSKKTV
jgi:hypothetical protein